GMAMVMFAMIICTVVIMSVVIQATQTLIVLDDKESAGFEIQTSSTLLSFFDPITDLAARIADQTEYDLSGVAVVGAVSEASVIVRQITPTLGFADWDNVGVAGVNDGYLQQAEQVYQLQSRAPGYADDAAVWQALRTRDDVLIVTPNLLERASEASTKITVGNDDVSVGKQITIDSETGAVAVQFEAGANANQQDADDGRDFRQDGDNGRGFRLQGVTREETSLPELWLEMRLEPAGDGFGNTNSAAPATITQRFQVIGVLDDESTLAGERVQMSLAALQGLSVEPVTPANFYVKVAEGADVQAVSSELERAFLSSGIDATVMAESFAAGQSVTRGILRLFQGFMALGLLVGIAALGVISSRTVVERRQQVGMLRAIGYQARMVAFSFLLESSFIALTGILIGTLAGLILGQNIVSTFFTDLTPDSTFAIPWLQIGGILLIAYAFSLLTTILPAYQAARIYPAEALRYE
ncbi:MAG: FtsX-like permease family protein, partial [Chloroflexota bacterium]|nr:FtsX-like permease family protein [Chloroflexota bacterium]